MKTSRIRTTHPNAIIDGWVDSLSASGSGSGSSGSVVDVGVTNGDATDLVAGDVVVLQSDGTVAKTTTALDTRPVGVALDDIDVGDAGPIAWAGPVPLINVVAAVTAGNYAATSTTGGSAQDVGATPGTGTFGYFTSSGTSPSGFLTGFGGGGSGGGSSTTLPWFIVTDPTYGAVGDGTTDDTSAINAAIAALNAAGGGVLYFPAGNYKCTSALTTITVEAVILGDGHGYADSHGDGGTEVRQTSSTAKLFTVTGTGTRFANIGLRCTAASPSAGSGINAQADFIRYDNVAVSNFYDCIDHEAGGAQKMDGCWIVGAVRYGVRVRNTSSPDGGDQAITNSWFYADQRNSTAAIRVESGGGLKISNCKINTFVSGHFWAQGIDVAPASNTTILLIANNSIENVTGHGIKIATSGAYWRHVVINGNQFGLYSNSTGNAININCGTLADVSQLVIAGCVFKQSGGGSAAAISLTKVDGAYLTSLVRDGFGSMFSTSGCTNILDATGGVAAGVAITGTPSSGDVPIASSGTAAAWGAPAASGAPTTADYLVGTANGSLSAEIVVGTSPGGELGGTWASPTVDSVHSGSAHVTTLDGLSDVVITSPASGDRIRYDGANFVNSALRWEPHVAYDGTVVLNGNGDPVMVEVS